jgi:hypothetical protein
MNTAQAYWSSLSNAIDTHHNKARANSSSMQLFVQQTPPFKHQGTSSASVFLLVVV